MRWGHRQPPHQQINPAPKKHPKKKQHKNTKQKTKKRKSGVSTLSAAPVLAVDRPSAARYDLVVHSRLSNPSPARLLHRPAPQPGNFNRPLLLARLSWWHDEINKLDWERSPHLVGVGAWQRWRRRGRCCRARWQSVPWRGGGGRLGVTASTTSVPTPQSPRRIWGRQPRAQAGIIEPVRAQAGVWVGGAAWWAWVVGGGWVVMGWWIGIRRDCIGIAAECSVRPVL